MGKKKDALEEEGYVKTVQQTDFIVYQKKLNNYHCILSYDIREKSFVAYNEFLSASTEETIRLSSVIDEKTLLAMLKVMKYTLTDIGRLYKDKGKEMNDIH